MQTSDTLYKADLLSTCVIVSEIAIWFPLSRDMLHWNQALIRGLYENKPSKLSPNKILPWRIRGMLVPLDNCYF